MDIQNDFLHGDLLKNVNTQLSLCVNRGIILQYFDLTNLYMDLNKPSTAIQQDGFYQSKPNYSFFTKISSNSFIGMFIYVNDMITIDNDGAIVALKNFLRTKFCIKDPSQFAIFS